MKNFSREDIKNYLLQKLNISIEILLYNKQIYNLDDETKKYYEELIENIIDELYDTTNTEIRRLTEKETFIIRKLLGILDNGQYQTQASIAKLLNVSPQRIHQIINYKINRKLRYTILFDEMAITKEEVILLSDPIQKLNLSLPNFAILHNAGIKTIKDITSLNELELSKLGIYSFRLREKIKKLSINLTSSLTETSNTETTQTINKPYTRKRELK